MQANFNIHIIKNPIYFSNKRYKLEWVCVWQSNSEHTHVLVLHKVTVKLLAMYQTCRIIQYSIIIC